MFFLLEDIFPDEFVLIHLCLILVLMHEYQYKQSHFVFILIHLFHTVHFCPILHLHIPEVV